MLLDAPRPPSNLTTSSLWLPHLLMEWLLPCIKPLRNLLPSRRWPQTLVPMIPLKIHLVLVKALSFMLSSLLHQTNSLKVKRKAKESPKLMPQNSALLNHLLVMLLKGSPNIHASFVGRITILKFFLDGLELVIFSKGPPLSWKSPFQANSIKW